MWLEISLRRGTWVQCLRAWSFSLWPTCLQVWSKYRLHPDDLCTCRNKDFWAPSRTTESERMEWNTELCMFIKLPRWSWDKLKFENQSFRQDGEPQRSVMIRFKSQKIRIQITNAYWPKDKTVSYVLHMWIYIITPVSLWMIAGFLVLGTKMVSNSQWVFSNFR